MTALSCTQVFRGRTSFDFQLLYRASEHGWSSEQFHQRCDNISNTFILLKTNNNITFGGFTTQIRNKGNGYLKDDNNAFIISFLHQKFYPIINGKNAVYNNKPGPDFVSASSFIIHFDPNLKSGNTTSKAESFYSGITQDYEINGGNKKFELTELEIFSIN